MDGEQIRIRGYQPDNRDEVYRICLQTADNGGDGTAIFRDPRLPGAVYAVPYAISEPALTPLAEYPGGVGGCGGATLDSQGLGRAPDRDAGPPGGARAPQAQTEPRQGTRSP